MSREIKYTFKFEDGTNWSYALSFDNAGKFQPKPAQKIKEWTKLEFHKCPHCPLASAQHTQCPVARSLEDVVEDSKNAVSCTMALVTVTTPERSYAKRCQTQEALHSLLGLLMASSGCPHLDWLRPLARYHLPFSQMDETLFRVLSLQLLAQYFNARESKLESCGAEIQKKYADVEKVNHAFIQRIRAYCDGDADKNAIAALDVFVQLFQYQWASDFDTIKALFVTDGKAG